MPAPVVTAIDDAPEMPAMVEFFRSGAAGTAPPGARRGPASKGGA